MVGFVYDQAHKGTLKKHPVQCFFARKEPDLLLAKKKEEEKAHEVKDSHKHMSLAQEPMQQMALRDRRKNVNLFEAHKPSKEMDDRITHINENQHLYSWKANTCMLSKDHPSYSCDNHDVELIQLDEEDHYKPKSLAEEKDFEIVHENWPA